MRAKDLKAKFKTKPAEGEPNPNEDIVLVDIRENDETRGGLGFDLPKEVTVEKKPMGELLRDYYAGKSSGILPYNKQIVLVCDNGKRSEMIFREIRGRHSNVDWLEGGISAYRSA